MSHFNIVVGDIDTAIDYYKRVFGFEEGMTTNGKSYRFSRKMLKDAGFAPGVFCTNAGFADGKCEVEAVWLRHPTIGYYLELFHCE